MFLSKVHVNGFKKIKEAELTLADVNILVGTNGAGKSSIIQAIHLSCCMMRQAARVSDSTATVGVDELDYLPTENYKALGHGADWGNSQGTASTRVDLTFEDQAATEKVAFCTLRSARNAGISIWGHVPPELSPVLRDGKKFFSAYIPGISGIPNREEKRSKKVVLKACSYGDSNVILRNALHLLDQESSGNLRDIERWIGDIFGKVEIFVNHEESKDLYISCDVAVGGVRKPIELAGTGFIQLIQIFCYVLLFKPGVLLIDEPDIHLHPDVQEKLVVALGRVAREKQMRVLMTTHSPFIVRGAPLDTNIYWLKDGDVASTDRSLIETALGWGAFGKSIIIVSEDSKSGLLRKILAQWPELERSVAFSPGTGFKGLPAPSQARDLFESLGGKFKILVHRDRDSLTDDEVDLIVKEYEAQGVSCWMPAESDVEAYFCGPAFLEGFLGIARQQVDALLDDIRTKQATPIQDQFAKQRKAHNEELWAAGGGPRNDHVWANFQARPLRGAKGKFVFGQLKNVQQQRFNDKVIQGCALGGQLALDLKHCLETMLASAAPGIGGAVQGNSIPPPPRQIPAPPTPPAAGVPVQAMPAAPRPALPVPVEFARVAPPPPAPAAPLPPAPGIPAPPVAFSTVPPAPVGGARPAPPPPPPPAAPQQVLGGVPAPPKPPDTQ